MCYVSFISLSTVDITRQKIKSPPNLPSHWQSGKNCVWSMNVIDLDGSMSYEQKPKSQHRGHCIEMSGMLFSLTLFVFQKLINSSFELCVSNWIPQLYATFVSMVEIYLSSYLD